MNKIKIGAINGKNIYSGNPNSLRDGEYYIQTTSNYIVGLFIKKAGKLIPVCSHCKEKQNEPNLQEISILTTYHGKEEELTPSEGYDGIGKVIYRKPKLEEKDTITITKNGVTEIEVGRGYDGLDDITVIVNVENNE